tara:strand:- start:5485 stop:6816 length:1332 start_codon:yes stop_codon:yes gene_type:complete
MENLYHIGRDNSKNEIYIIDDSVSKIHAQLLIDKNADLIIIDLSSKNGVYINNEKIVSPRKLLKDDKIRLGNVTFFTQDIVNSIKIFENNKKENNTKNIPLILSSNNKEKKKEIKSENSNFNKIIAISSLVLLVLASLLIYNYFNDQNKIKNIFNNETIDVINDINNDATEIINDIKIVNPKDKKNKKKSDNDKKQSSEIIYDFSCLSDQEGVNDMIYEFGDLTREIQNTILNDVEITIQDEKKAGNDYLKEILKEKKNINSGRDYIKINRILNDLTSRLLKPRGIDYEIFLIDDTIQNVFTLGGNIIFYKGMYDFCDNDSEIASIIAHEIAHNELGHSTLALKKQKFSSDFGIFGEIALLIENIASASFNQKQETEADMFGMDLIYPTKYNNCSAVDIWKRMSQNEKEFNFTDNLFRSHPYSKDRANCLDNHLKKNYSIDCN